MQTKQVNKGAKRVRLLLLVTKIFDHHVCMTKLFTAAHLGLIELITKAFFRNTYKINEQ